MLEVLALGAVLAFPTAAALAQTVGGPLLFSDATAAHLSECVLTADPIDLRDIDTRRALWWLDMAESFTPRFPERPNDPAWALAVVKRQARERADVLLIPTLRWSADALTHGWRSGETVIRELSRVASVALGREVLS